MRAFLRIKNTELYADISKPPAKFTLLRYASNFDPEKDKKYVDEIIEQFKQQKVAELEIVYANEI